MLGELTPEQFDEWLASERLDGRQENRLAAILCRGFTILAQLWGAKDIEPEDFDPRSGVLADNTPHSTGQARQEPPSTSTASPNQAAYLAAMAFGVPGKKGK